LSLKNGPGIFTAFARRFRFLRIRQFINHGDKLLHFEFVNKIAVGKLLDIRQRELAKQVAMRQVDDRLNKLIIDI